MTGLYYFNARWYDPSVGRFITEDSYGGRLSDPMSMNRYIYARDDPERYTDPSGHSYGRMFTDYNDPDYVPGSTVVTCSGGVCTVTTTEVSGGYTDSISTQISTIVTTVSSPAGTKIIQTTSFTTAMTDTGPNQIGGGTTTVSGYVTSSVDSWISATTPTVGATTNQISGPGYGLSWGQVEAGGVLVGKAAATIGLFAAGFATFNPFLVEAGAYSAVGFADSANYAITAGPSATPQHTFSTWAEWPLHVVASFPWG